MPYRNIGRELMELAAFTPKRDIDICSTCRHMAGHFAISYWTLDMEGILGGR